MVSMRPLWLALWLAVLYHSPQGTRAAPADPQTRVRGHHHPPGRLVSDKVTPADDHPARQKVLQEVTRLRRRLLQALSDDRGWAGEARDPRSWDSLVTSTRRSFLSLTPLYLPDPTRANPQCRHDLLTLYQAMVDLPQLVQDGVLWPLKLVDSWGKLADGLLVGNTKVLGFFTECLNIDVRQDSMGLHRLPDPDVHLPGPLDDLPDLQGGPPSLHNAPDLREQESPLELLRSVPDFQRKTVDLEREVPDPQRDSSWPLPDSSSLQASFQGKYCLLSYSRRANDTEGDGPVPAVRVPAISAFQPLLLEQMMYATCIPSSCTHLELKISLEMSDRPPQILGLDHPPRSSLLMLEDPRLLWSTVAHAFLCPQPPYHWCEAQSQCEAAQTVWESVNAAVDQSGLRVGGVACQTRQEHHALGDSEICGFVLLSMVGVVLLTATLVDVWSQATGRFDLRDGELRYLLAFSVTRNLTKIFRLETRRSSQVISCLHGIRFLSISWVVLGHQYAYSVSLAQNPLDALQVTRAAGFQVIANGDLSVDTFFLMSGLLVCLGVMGQVTRTGQFNVPLYYAHRVVRLLPPIAMTVLVVATVSGLMVGGPVSPPYTTYYLKGCRHSWWMDVTFTSNLVFPFLSQMGKTDEGATCLPHCWYTGVDMQLYLVMPLVLLPLCHWPRTGTVLLGLWTVVSLVIPSVIVGVYRTWPSSLLVQDPEAMLEFNHKVYLMPWCRAGPYLVGVWAGYIIHKARESPRLARLQPWQVVVGWASAVAVALAVVFGLVRYNVADLPARVPHMSLAEAVLYGGLHRAAWGAAVAWLVLACHWGYGGPVDWFLSHPLWQPLSRLTYSIYLTSLPIQFMLLYSTTRTTYFSHIIKVEETCGVLLIVLLASLLLSLASESPVLGLEKLLLQPSRPPQRVEEQPKGDVSPTEEQENVKVDLQGAKGDPQADLASSCTGLDPTVD